VVREGCIRAGVVGVGSMGENHARIYSQLPGVELVGVFDIDYLKAAVVAKKYGTNAFRDLNQMLDSCVDVVSITVPASRHHEVVSYCARAGCHILLEKPIAAELSQAEMILQECELNGVRLMVGHVERFNSVVQAVKELLKAEDVISLSFTRVGPKPPRVKDVGVIKDMGVHDIDLLRYLTGREIISIYSLVANDYSSKSGEYGKEDIGIIAFELEGGILAHLSVNWVTPYKVRKMEIATVYGYIEADLLNRKAHFYNRGKRGIDHDHSEMNVTWEEPLEREIRVFLDCLMSGNEFPVSVSDALKALEIAHVCSSNHGRLVTFHSNYGSKS